MTYQVSSYAYGSWVTPTGTDGTPILDASTGAVVALVGDNGLDYARMVQHARTVGGPALRVLTFHERATALRALGKYLNEHKEDIYVDYGTTGGTVADMRVDVDGGIAVLFAYSSMTRKELPNDTVLAEGRPIGLGEANLAQTFYTSPHGVGLHINAYNFPCWGILEKLATSIIAGVPVIVKPATASAHVAERVVRGIVESGALPAGSVQLISGSIGDLMDHLGGQDHVAFTGSAWTAAKLRGHACVLQRGTHFNAEADSLNASILGPDAVAGTPEFDIYVTGVFREMSSKAGQKCTSIRRAFVPAAQVDAVIEALRAKLAKVVLGDPRVEGTRMGPLISPSQRDDVAEAVRTLMRGAEVAVGGPDAPLSLASGDAEKGSFFPLTVLKATDPRATELHSVEAFGPVCTVIPYADPADLAELVALGQGSLVASIVSYDKAFLKELIGAIAAYHGRLLILDRDNAATSFPHGAPLPQLIHGGPGRAGGGQELGGMHSVKHLLQATSIASSPSALMALSSTWNTGVTPTRTQVHPFRLYLEDLQLGDTCFTGSRTITLEDVEHFAHFTGDTFYAHMDEEAATASPIFEGRVAHGYFILACAAGLFVDPEPGPVLANYGLENLRFVQPMYFGDTMTVRLTCKHKGTPRPGATMAEVTWDVAVTNQRDELCASYELLTMNACRPTG